MATRKIYDSGFSTKALDVLIYGGMFILLLFVFRGFIGKLIADIRGKKADNILDEIGTGANKSAEQASRLRNAMNPSGYEWMRNSDGTDEDAIFKVAAEITDFAAVSSVYRTLYQESLTADLSKELNANEYAKFIGIVTQTAKEPEAQEVPTGSVETPKDSYPTTPGTSGLTAKFKAGTEVKAGFTWLGINVRSGKDIYKVVGGLFGGNYAGKVLKTLNFRADRFPNLGTPGKYVLLENPKWGEVYVYEDYLEVN